MPELFDKLNTEAADEARVIKLPAVPVQVKVPLKVWVVPAVKVIVCGAVKVRLLKVALPETACVAPFKVTVPELWVKVPELEKFPATFIFAEDGAVSVLEPEMVRLLNELVELPEIAVVPLKVTVPERAVNAPLFAQLPATFNP